LHIRILAMAKTIPKGALHSGMPRTGSRVIVLVVPPVEELDLVGPLQVFSAVNRLAGRNIYSTEIVTSSRELIIHSEGGLLTFLAQSHFQDVKERFDSVLLVCGVGSRTTRDPALRAWLKTISTGVRRLGSVCVGAFLLAEAGLLNGKNATAHWKFGQQLAKQYPKVKVQSNPLWVKDGNIYTSAGISAGIDLALAWVEEDCGAALAHEAARELVLFLRRPGGQQQLSVSLGSQASEMRSIQELQIWIAENCQKKFSMRDLAERISMSPRTFERVFTREVGMTPSQYVLRTRVEAAQRHMERTNRGLKQIAAACGFGSTDLMRRAFVRLLGTTPGHYRNQLQAE